MHQHHLSCAMSALAFGLSLGLAACGGGSSSPPAPQSPQNVIISGTVAHDVCGNGDASNDGNTPCFSTITSGNTVTIASGGQVWGQNSSSYSHVYGAYNDTDTNAVRGNQVVVNGIVSGDVFGGEHVLTSGDATASGNSVTIGSGGLVGNVYGGYAETGDGSATASNNTVLIDGITTSLPAIIGGSASSNTGATIVTGNTVTIQNIPLYSSMATLWGESKNMSLNPLPTDNNTLNLHAADLSVSSMGGFQNLNFFLPSSLAAVGTLPSAGQDCAGLSMGSAADQADSMLINGNYSNLGTDTVVHVSLDGAGPPLHTGDQFVLIRAGTEVDVPNWIIGNLAAESETGEIGGYKYTLALVQQGGTNTCGDLVLTIGSPAS